MNSRIQILLASEGMNNARSTFVCMEVRPIKLSIIIIILLFLEPLQTHALLEWNTNDKGMHSIFPSYVHRVRGCNLAIIIYTDARAFPSVLFYSLCGYASMPFTRASFFVCLLNERSIKWNVPIRHAELGCKPKENKHNAINSSAYFAAFLNAQRKTVNHITSIGMSLRLLDSALQAVHGLFCANAEH